MEGAVPPSALWGQYHLQPEGAVPPSALGGAVPPSAWGCSTTFSLGGQHPPENSNATFSFSPGAGLVQQGNSSVEEETSFEPLNPQGLMWPVEDKHLCFHPESPACGTAGPGVVVEITKLPNEGMRAANRLCFLGSFGGFSLVLFCC